MPNPYENNDKAAAFVDYYASERMLSSSVHRLYHGGIARQQQARITAEQEVYPERYQAPVRRSQAEIDRYLQERVETELLRRQQHRAALQRELHPETESPPQYIEKRTLQKQVRRLYTESVRQRKARDEKLERVFGRDRSEEDLVRGSRSASEVAELRRREAGWRTPSISVPHDEDNRVSLASQYEYYANPQKFTELYVVAKQPRRMTQKEREHQMKRLTDLSRPLSVTPRRVAEEKDANAPRPFHVHRKIDYADEHP